MTAVHATPHFTSDGYCNCDCALCHAPLSNKCWCTCCACETPEECAEMVGYSVEDGDGFR